MNPECRGELLARARRGVASDAERTALEAHLGTCPACRLADDITHDFDAAGEADVADSQRIRRIAAAAERHVQARRSPLRRLRATRRILLAAAAVLVVGGAAAAASSFWPSRVEVSVVSPTAPVAAVPSPRLAAPAAAPAPAAPLPAPSRPAPAAGASELYRAANEARRSGDAGRAIRLYEELQRTYPQSAEAGLATVSLGRLLLAGGSAAAALRQFDRCLASSAASRLGAEALYGRALALQALGRQREESATWQRLLAAYPNSAYATHARRAMASSSER
jgi:TolA-binding protein